MIIGGATGATVFRKSGTGWSGYMIDPISSVQAVRYGPAGLYLITKVTREGGGPLGSPCCPLAAAPWFARGWPRQRRSDAPAEHPEFVSLSLDKAERDRWSPRASARPRPRSGSAMTPLMAARPGATPRSSPALWGPTSQPLTRPRSPPPWPARSRQADVFSYTPADQVAPAHRRPSSRSWWGRPMSRPGRSCASPTGRPMPTGTALTSSSSPICLTCPSAARAGRPPGRSCWCWISPGRPPMSASSGSTPIS